VRELGNEIHGLVTQVLLTCDRMGLIGREMFAIDGVKLPANASKERSGTHAELVHRANRLDKAARRIIEAHQQQDKTSERRREMHQIWRLMSEGTPATFAAIPEQFRSMKRLWLNDPDARGLLERRELEAKLFEAGLA
jgi:hypothetical protein